MNQQGGTAVIFAVILIAEHRLQRVTLRATLCSVYIYFHCMYVGMEVNSSSRNLESQNPNLSSFKAWNIGPWALAFSTRERHKLI